MPEGEWFLAQGTTGHLWMDQQLVVPAEAGTQADGERHAWTPACAAVTGGGMVPGAGGRPGTRGWADNTSFRRKPEPRRTASDDPGPRDGKGEWFLAQGTTRHRWMDQQHVVPAKAGTQADGERHAWTPACAGVTRWAVVPAKAGTQAEGES